MLNQHPAPPQKALEVRRYGGGWKNSCTMCGTYMAMVKTTIYMEPEVALSEDVIRCQELIKTYQDLDLELADAAVIATAERLKIERILTVDERAFRAARPKGGRPFLLLPADRK